MLPYLTRVSFWLAALAAGMSLFTPGSRGALLASVLVFGALAALSKENGLLLPLFLLALEITLFRFSAADVYFGSQLGWGLMIKSIEPRPAFQEYVNRLQKRPAHVRFMEKSKELEEALKKRAG